MLAALTLVWLGIEGAVGVVAGVLAGSIALVAFGFAAFRTRRAEQAAAREAAKADAMARAQPQALACSFPVLEPVGAPEPFVEEPIAAKPVEPEPIKWRTSARGNPWAMVGDLHIVIFPDNNDQWCARVQRGEGRGRYLTHTWASAEEAQAAIERAIALRGTPGERLCRL